MPDSKYWQTQDQSEKMKGKKRIKTQLAKIMKNLKEAKIERNETYTSATIKFVDKNRSDEQTNISTE